MEAIEARRKGADFALVDGQVPDLAQEVLDGTADLNFLMRIARQLVNKRYRLTAAERAVHGKTGIIVESARTRRRRLGW